MAQYWIHSVASLIFLATIFSCCLGAEHQVGNWVTGVDFKSWAKAETFSVGDTLKFTYKAAVHNVWELGSQAEYDSCDISNPIKTYNEDDAVVSLTTQGKHFYVCGVPGHCKASMKFIANVVSVSTAPVTAPAASPQSGASLTSLSFILLLVLLSFSLHQFLL